MVQITNAAILLIRHLGTNFSEILIAIHIFSFKKMHLKMSSAKRWPFCLGLNVLKIRFWYVDRISARKGLRIYRHMILSWWRQQMEPFSALLVLCEGNPVTGGFPSQRLVTRSFDVFSDLRLYKRLSKQSMRWWIETPSSFLWRRCNDSPGICMFWFPFGFYVQLLVHAYHI